MMKIFNNIIFLFFLCFFVLYSNSSAAKNELNFVVHANKGHLDAYSRWQPLADYLSLKTGFNVKITPLDFNQLEQSLMEKTADLIVSNVNFFSVFRERYDLKPIATLKRSPLQSPVCGLIIAKKDSGITKNEDLIGKKIAIVSDKAFNGFMDQTVMLLEHGIDIRKKSILWSSQDQEIVPFAVLNKSHDAGFVTANYFYNLSAKQIINPDDFTIINPIKYDELPYFCSTPIYPDWPIYVSNDMDEAMFRKIQQALLDVEKEPELKKKLNYSFITPADYSSVKRVVDILSGVRSVKDMPQKPSSNRK